MPISDATCTSIDVIDHVLPLTMVVATLSKLQQVASLDLEQSGLDGGGAPQPPQQARQSKDQLSFNGRLRVVVGRDRHFECRIILGIFQRT